jgi:Kef-type K+ transport system membrane component KefB
MGIYFKFILTFGLILIAARIGGEIAERYLKQPPVLGELLAGIIISPFAVGGMLFHDPIILNFATIEGRFLETGEEISKFHIMEVISEIAVICLLFVAGVETDVRTFLRQGITGSLVAVGGVILPFIFGYVVTMTFYPKVGQNGWLFMGAVLVATSIGLTVRILMEMGKLNTVEGATILVAAVVDDIIGIVILSVVSQAAQTGTLDILNGIQIAIIGFAVWFALLMFGVRFHGFISRFLLGPFKRSGTSPIFAIILGFIIAYLVTLVDLHPVVGAYVAGLMFASTSEREEIAQGTRPIMLFLAPFFFTYLGMQVDLTMFGAAKPIAVALLLILLAIVGKVVGCYIPARAAGKLPHREGMIVGVGMVPRGEVGLIVAGAGLLVGALGGGDMARELFGIAVLTSIVTTLVTPAMLKPLFKEKATSQASLKL